MDALPSDVFIHDTYISIPTWVVVLGVSGIAAAIAVIMVLAKRWGK